MNWFPLCLEPAASEAREVLQTCCDTLSDAVPRTWHQARDRLLGSILCNWHSQCSGKHHAIRPSPILLCDGLKLVRLLRSVQNRLHPRPGACNRFPKSLQDHRQSYDKTRVCEGAAESVMDSMSTLLSRVPHS